MVEKWVLSSLFHPCLMVLKNAQIGHKFPTDPPVGETESKVKLTLAAQDISLHFQAAGFIFFLNLVANNCCWGGINCFKLKCKDPSDKLLW